MAAPTTIDEAITQALLLPASVTDPDGRTITERPLKDLQDARDRESGNVASTKPHFGLRFTQLVPPGGG
jgi:hypothetical protein